MRASFLLRVRTVRPSREVLQEVFADGGGEKRGFGLLGETFMATLGPPPKRKLPHGRFENRPYKTFKAGWSTPPPPWFWPARQAG